MDLINKPSKIKIISHLLLLAAAVWVAESCVHSIIFFEHSVWESMFLDVPMHEFYMRFLFMVAGCMLYLLLIKNRNIKETEKYIENIFNSVIPVCITNKDYEIVMANNNYWNIWGKPKSGIIKCYDHRPGAGCHTEKCALTQIINGMNEFTCESQKNYNKKNHSFIVTARPFLNSQNEVIGVIESFQDITDRKKLEDEKTSLVTQLQSSLEKVKLLSGFLPICASCKKVRDDKGYWNLIENYIRDNSEAEFSHGICPECAMKLYPELMKEK